MEDKCRKLLGDHNSTRVANRPRIRALWELYLPIQYRNRKLSSVFLQGYLERRDQFS